MTTLLHDDRIQVRFSDFSLEQYQLFLKTKTLPEQRLAYDWQADTYTIETHKRFAGMLGMAIADTAALPCPLASYLLDYQAAIVTHALEAERYAAWLDTGLGKTAIFLEWSRQVYHKTSGRVLILSPLGIIPQTLEQRDQFYGDTLPIQRLDSREALSDWCTHGHGIAISNYDKLIPGTIDSMHQLDGLALDEGSILKSSGGVVKWNLIKSARGVRHKISCTATPAPNDFMEFASQASFLERLSSEGEVLWTYFSRDKYGNWNIKAHAKDAFYRFLASWSCYVRNPASFGWQDVLADLPEPDVRPCKIDMTDEQRAAMNKLAVTIGSGLFNDEHLGIKERIKFAQIARGFLYVRDAKNKQRVQRIHALKPAYVAQVALEDMAEGRQVIIWTVFDEEAAILKELIGQEDIGILHGKMDEDARLDVISRFKLGLYRCLITKPQLAGYGMNFQNCTSMAFSGIDDSFERFYQSIRRAYRFGQTEIVRVHIPFVEPLEGHIWENIQRKETAFIAAAQAHEIAYKKATAQGEKI